MRADNRLTLRTAAQAVKAKTLSGSSHAASGAADLAFRPWRHGDSFKKSTYNLIFQAAQAFFAKNPRLRRRGLFPFNRPGA